jgi:hypothetical protein
MKNGIVVPFKLFLQEDMFLAQLKSICMARNFEYYKDKKSEEEFLVPKEILIILF